MFYYFIIIVDARYTPS